MPNLILILNAASTWYMVGLIWMVQIVHYPLFAKVSETNYREYQVLHQKLTTWVVGPPMLIEVFTTVLLIYFLPRGVTMTGVMIGIGLLAVIWLSTAFLQVPCHNALSDQFDVAVHRRLVSSNWIRTVAWTARGALVGLLALGIAHSPSTASVKFLPHHLRFAGGHH